MTRRVNLLLLMASAATAKLRNTTVVPKILIATHHKCGTILLDQVLAGINSLSEVKVYRGEWWRADPDPKEQMCMVHVVRNPFQMLVSGYAYHKAGKEIWCKTRLDTTLNQRLEDLPDWQRHYLWSVKELWNPRFPLRMRPLDTETYAEYLSRIPLDDGLLAEAYRTLAIRPPPLETIFRRVENAQAQDHTNCQPRNYCLDQLVECELSHDDACLAFWDGFYRDLGIDDSSRGVFVDRTLDSFAALAPADIGRHGTSHDSTRTAIVERLVDLDRSVLNGTIRDLEDLFGCPRADMVMASASLASRGVNARVGP